MTDTAGIGHNLSPFEEIRQRTDDLVKAADEWLAKVPEITDEATAGKASDFLDQLRGEFKAAEKERKAEKQPHLDAAKDVDETYKPIKTRLEKAADAIKGLLTPYLRRKQEAEEAARRKAEEEARKAREEAERRAREAKSIEDRIAAEEAAEKAKAAAENAERDRKAQAKGEFGRTTTLRTTYRGEITDYNKALAVYAQDPLVSEALEKAVNRDIRAGKRVIPGVRIIQEQKAA